MKPRNEAKVLVALPSTAAYYFEITGRGSRLLYYIPPSHLQRLVRRQEIQASVLDDYPDGIELEISDEAFKTFRCEYGYAHPFDADAIWDAFEFLRTHTLQHHSFRGTGFIRPPAIQETARAVNRALKQACLVRRKRPTDTVQQLPDQEKRRIALQNDRYRRQVDRALRSMSVPKVNPRLTIDKQLWSRVPLQRGVSPVHLLLHLHQGQAEGGRHNGSSR